MAGVVREIWRARLPDVIGTPRGERRPMLPAAPFLLAAAAVLGLTTAALVGSAAVAFAPALLAGAVAAAPVAIVHARPGVAVAACAAMNLAHAWPMSVIDPALASPPWFLNPLPAQLITAFVVAVALRGRAASAVIATVVIAGMVFVPLAGELYTGPMLVPLLYWPAMLAAAGLLGARVRDGHQRTSALVAEAERVQVRAERDRIAHELHDVVAHHMSVIAVRAVSAPRRIPGLPAGAVTEFGELAGAAREALGDLRQLLGMLDDQLGSGAADERTPQPVLADLQLVAERTRSAGTPVELSVDEPPALPVAVAMSAFRIVQEALSNVTRHATGAPTVVRVAADGAGDRLVVEVVNAAPPGPRAERLPGTGRGMIGMRERVRLLGGTFDAAPTPDGGFRVRAELKVEGAR